MVLTQTEREVLAQQVADISSHLSEYPQPTEAEKKLLATIDFLCLAIMTLVA